MPEELKVEENWTLFDFESVFAAFREDTVFASEMYNDTIGLVFGPTILGMHGKQHHDHRSLVSKAFKQSALKQWEPEVIDPICDQLVDEFKNDGEADLVKAVTFEFPTRVTAALLGLPQEDLEMFRRLSLRPHFDHRGHRGGPDGVGRIGHLLPGAGRPAAQHDDRRRHRRPRRRGDRRREAHRRGDHLVPAVASARRAGDDLSVLGQSAAAAAHPSRPTRRRCSRIATSFRPRSRRGIRYETPLVLVTRNTTRDVEMHGMHDPGGRAGQPVHGFGQSRRNALDRPRTCSTSTGRGVRTSRSRAASTAASACTWPGSKRRRCSTASSIG